MAIGCKTPTWNRLFEERKKLFKQKNAIHVILYCHACTCFAKFNIVIFQYFICKDVKPW